MYRTACSTAQGSAESRNRVTNQINYDKSALISIHWLVISTSGFHIYVVYGIANVEYHNLYSIFDVHMCMVRIDIVFVSSLSALFNSWLTRFMGTCTNLLNAKGCCLNIKNVVVLVSRAVLRHTGLGGGGGGVYS